MRSVAPNAAPALPHARGIVVVAAPHREVRAPRNRPRRHQSPSLPTARRRRLHPPPILPETPLPAGSGIAVAKVLRRIFMDRMARFEAASAAWERQMACWSRLCYCSRCDRIYDPQNGRSAPVDEMNALLGS